METLEILLYIGVIVLIGGFITFFLTDINYNEMYVGLKGIFFKDKSAGFEKVQEDEIYLKVQDFLDSCRTSDGSLQGSFYAEGSGVFTKADLFSYYKEVSWCNSIQSAANNCGEREDVTMVDIELPRVFVMKCINSQRVEIS